MTEAADAQPGVGKIDIHAGTTAGAVVVLELDQVGAREQMMVRAMAQFVEFGSGNGAGSKDAVLDLDMSVLADAGEAIARHGRCAAEGANQQPQEHTHADRNPS